MHVRSQSKNEAGKKSYSHISKREHQYKKETNMKNNYLSSDNHIFVGSRFDIYIAYNGRIGFYAFYINP